VRKQCDSNCKESRKGTIKRYKELANSTPTFTCIVLYVQQLYP